MTHAQKLRSFEDLLAIAQARKGGADAFEASLSSPKSPKELAAIPDHRWALQYVDACFSSWLQLVRGRQQVATFRGGL